MLTGCGGDVAPKGAETELLRVMAAARACSLSTQHQTAAVNGLALIKRTCSPKEPRANLINRMINDDMRFYLETQ